MSLAPITIINKKNIQIHIINQPSVKKHIKHHLTVNQQEYAQSQVTTMMK